MPHCRPRVELDRPPPVDQPPSEVGLLQRIKERRCETADLVERAASDHRCAARERCGSTPTRRTEAGVVAPYGLVALVDDAQAHHSEAPFSGEALANVGEDAVGDELTVIVQEAEQRCGRCFGTTVPAAGDSHVVLQVDDHIGIYADHRSAVPDDHDLRFDFGLSSDRRDRATERFLARAQRQDHHRDLGHPEDRTDPGDLL